MKNLTLDEFKKIHEDWKSPNFVNVSPKTHRRTVERFACAFP